MNSSCVTCTGDGKTEIAKKRHLSPISFEASVVGFGGFHLHGDSQELQLADRTFEEALLGDSVSVDGPSGCCTLFLRSARGNINEGKLKSARNFELQCVECSLHLCTDIFLVASSWCCSRTSCCISQHTSASSKMELLARKTVQTEFACHHPRMTHKDVIGKRWRVEANAKRRRMLRTVSALK